MKKKLKSFKERCCFNHPNITLYGNYDETKTWFLEYYGKLTAVFQE